MDHYWCYMDTPIGKLKIVGVQEGIISTSFTEEDMLESKMITLEMERCRQQLREYFRGKRKSFELKLILEGTEKQFALWQAIYQIPYGEMSGIRMLAYSAEDKREKEVVIHDLCAHPFAVLVPCHRIIDDTEELSLACGGEERKKWLMAFESENI
ncbi:MAG: MGMT family protein [Clostridiales bacterium]|nr:MGMT family protein [Clostridiales bacterium]